MQTYSEIKDLIDQEIYFLDQFGREYSYSCNSVNERIICLENLKEKYKVWNQPM